MSPTAPHSGIFRLMVKPNGDVVAPDLAAHLLPVLQRLGGEAAAVSSERIACAVRVPKLTTLRQPACEIPAIELPFMPTDRLWALHTELLRSPGRQVLPSGASLLDVKIEIGKRLLRSCVLCERRCEVNRLSNEHGFCGLGKAVVLSGYSMIYNEGPCVGQPTFGVYVKGCSLRCEFCYRPDDRHGNGEMGVSPTELAAVLDDAARAGAESWHFLGGNPDQSFVGILEALAYTETILPIVWNSAFFLTPETVALLKGVVDIWLPDLKFGSDACAARIAQADGYCDVLHRNLLALANEKFVVVRHMAYPGHEQCCKAMVEDWLRRHLSNAQIHHLRYFSGSFGQHSQRTPSRKEC